jgi:hypothetical protein
MIDFENSGAHDYLDKKSIATHLWSIVTSVANSGTLPPQAEPPTTVYHIGMSAMTPADPRSTFRSIATFIEGISIATTYESCDCAFDAGGGRP